MLSVRVCLCCRVCPPFALVDACCSSRSALRHARVDRPRADGASSARGRPVGPAGWWKACPSSSRRCCHLLVEPGGDGHDHGRLVNARLRARRRCSYCPLTVGRPSSACAAPTATSTTVIGDDGQNTVVSQARRHFLGLTDATAVDRDLRGCCARPGPSASATEAPAPRC